MDFVTHSPAFADFDQPLSGGRHKEGEGGRHKEGGGGRHKEGGGGRHKEGRGGRHKEGGGGRRVIELDTPSRLSADEEGGGGVRGEYNVSGEMEIEEGEREEGGGGLTACWLSPPALHLPPVRGVRVRDEGVGGGNVRVAEDCGAASRRYRTHTQQSYCQETPPVSLFIFFASASTPSRGTVRRHRRCFFFKCFVYFFRYRTYTQQRYCQGTPTVSVFVFFLYIFRYRT
jgi:hypothetical protein